MILVTAHADAAIERRANHAGVAVLLEKPVPVPTLINHLKDLTAQS